MRKRAWHFLVAFLFLTSFRSLSVCLQTTPQSSMTSSGLILPGGFAPDYMRRNAKMLEIVSFFVASCLPVAAICHGQYI